MASIEKRGDTYRIRVSNGFDYKGRRVSVSMTYTPRSKKESAIEKEVLAEAIKFEERVRSGEYYSGETVSFMDFAETWLEDWAKKHVTTGTQESYWNLLGRWVFPRIGTKKLSKITAFDIQNIVKDMETAGRAPGSIRRAIAATNSVMKYAYRMNVVRENVVDRVELPKMGHDDELHYFTLEQSKRFLEALEQKYPFQYSACVHSYDADGGANYREAYTAYHTIPLQYQSYFYLAVYGGFRRGELIALTWKDVDFEKRSVTINKAASKTKSEGQIIKDPKTKAGFRTIQLPKKCFQILRSWKAEQKRICMTLGDAWEGFRGAEYDNNSVFIDLKSGKMMNLDTPGHKFEEIVEMYNRSCENEKDRLPRIRLHDLRHTSATLLLSENVDIETVSHRLGHSKASVTLDVYGHALETMDSKASDTLEVLFG